MIAEIYNALFLFANDNGALVSLFVLSFLFALFVYVITLPISYYFRKKNKPLGLIGKSVLYFGIVFAAWFVIIVVEGIGLSSLFSIFIPSLEGYAVFLLTALIYDEVIELNKSLPWMIVQLFLIWVSQFVIWYYLIYVVKIFGEYVFLTI